jgi:NADPH-dependent 2,4-dienoyl-CoA reductase/sulfur reductase-like enzyme
MYEVSMKIVIIGGIAAGMSAAAKARRVNKDAKIIVFEMGEIISFGACGLPYFVGDFFSNPNYMIARKVQKMQEEGVDVRTLHQVVSINAQKKSLQVKNMQTDEVFEEDYDKLMIATGANVIKPPFKNIHLNNIFTLSKMNDGLELKEAAMSEKVKDVTIIGAGFIGIEVVEAMKKLGKHVRLIQRGSRVFNRIFDERITELMHEELLEHGVELVLNEGVESFEGEDAVQKVVTDKGSYKTDLVVIATGFRPNTDFLQGSGLKMLSNGAIVVDKKAQTTLKDIYAAGDCATVPHMVTNEDVYIPLATGANKLGRIAGENMAGGAAEYPGSLGSACVKVMDYEAAVTGLNEEQAEAKGIACESVFIKDKNQAGYYPNQQDIYIKLVYEKETKIIIGGETLGKNGAALRIDVIAMAIRAKMTTGELGMMDFCYAPPISKTWDALNVAGNVAK